MVRLRSLSLTTVLMWMTLLMDCHYSESNSILPGCGRLAVNVNSHNIKKLPWDAKLERQNELKIDAAWTAVIITENLVLTVNSVWDSFDLSRISPYEKYTVYTNLTSFSTDKDDPNIHKSKITHLRLHPNYLLSDPKYRINNYILAHLKTPLTFDTQINSVCLFTDENLKNLYQCQSESDTMFISGWTSKYYTKTFRKLIANDDNFCNSMWMKETKQNIMAYENHICTNVTEGEDNGCITYLKGAVALNDVYDNGTYFFMGLLNTHENPDCADTVFIPQLDTETVQWISNNIRCGPNNYTCNNGECVSLDSVCNEIDECSDFSDEDPNFCHDRFLCKISKRSIMKEKICDSIKDCENGEDEEGCSNTIAAPDTIWKIFWSLSAVIIAAVLLVSVLIFLLKKNKDTVRDLTDDEVKEFHEGDTQILRLENTEYLETGELDVSRGAYVEYSQIENTEDPEYLNNLIRQMKWDTTYEIAKSLFFINKKQFLGGGEYGAVYGGVYVQKNNGNYSICKNVAVKTVKSCNDIEHFKALLSELKVLVYVGRHENIVELIGANTEEIRQRDLQIIMELCPHGSLESYLRSNNYSFVSLTNPEGVANPSNPLRYESSSETKRLTTFDLLHWCQQVANAMEFLTSKHVIHGDLAIRNVLLSFNYVAKVGDFGLSTKLYEYRTYCVKNNVPLPIPWLSIESITDNKFSHESDVWSFGVTMWEILSLGKEPYDGQARDFKFYVKLRDGLRLENPPHATPEMYNLMRSCWNCEPSERPTFKSLKKALAIYENEITDNFDPSAHYVTIDLNDE